MRCRHHRGFGRDRPAKRKIADARAKTPRSHKILILLPNKWMHLSETESVIVWPVPLALDMAAPVPDTVVPVAPLLDMAGAASVALAQAVSGRVDRVVQVGRDSGPAEESLICRYLSQCDFLAAPATRSLISRFLVLAESVWLATLTRCRYRRPFLRETTLFAMLGLGVKWCFVAPAVD